MILLLSLLAAAHRLESGVLALREVESGRYVVRWSPPAVAPAEPMPVLDCTRQPLLWDCGSDGPSRIEAAAGALVVIERLDGARAVHSLTPARPRWQADTPSSPPGPSGWLPLGMRHALSGADHMLFVAGLVVLVERLRPLLLTVTAFTIAHSLTLAAAALQLVSLPSAPVEACIALSLVLLAVELTRAQPAGPSWRLAAAFGLLHGFGFADALAEIGLPAGQQVPALLGFNIGVELAQVLVVLVAFLPARWLRARGGQWVVAYVLGPLGVAWVIDRILVF